ncbi:hypothetical protein ACF3NG_06695 [Aerococcaceae bacterium WGS1372]
MSLLPEDYIGKIYKVRFPYFDSSTKKRKFKARPMLIIGIEKNNFPCDFVVLPVSSVSNSDNISREFDKKITGNDCTLLNLKKDPSYIRIHKQGTANSNDVDRNGQICDLKQTLPVLYRELNDLSVKFLETLY